jgi:two-component system cell cycle sensor histidine kinase/response regulator CckA
METPSQSPRPDGGASERWILVVDDEPAIQNVLQLSLTRPGWEVRVAGSAAQALATIESSPTPPSLLISDVLMPGLDGLELTRRILARVPDIKVIITSGHLTDSSWWPNDLREHCFLPKPFSSRELFAAVQDAFSDFGPLS